MNTNHFTAFGTNPFTFFIPNKRSDPNFIYHFEIINHAHAILDSISPIQLFQPGARENITTIGTILGFAFSAFFAVSDLTRRAVF